ncbi:tryptophan-rich sensory protein [Candidatus Saccharibacteria bacterium]|nr:tryptophan-rich sensory protein [Candidatus Saccharibacteria bacterium]
MKKKMSNKKCSFIEILKAGGMILAPLVGGVIITLFTVDAQEAFGKFQQPPLSPPAWLFPVAWTILYILMGVASWLIYRSEAKKPAEKRLKKKELILFYTQLGFNFLWTILFFNADLKYFAFGWLMIMWMMILALMIMTWRNARTATWLLVPYILWCTFAAYLNLGVAVLN